MDLIGIRGGQNSVAGAVRDFRRNVAEVLRAEQGLTCGAQGVIRSGGPGYRLNEWIITRDAGADAVDPSATQAAAADGPETDRRERILAELRRGEQLRAPAIADRLGSPLRTVKRRWMACVLRDASSSSDPPRAGSID